MRRRQFLASGTALLAVAVAGCGHPSVVLDMDEATDGDIADEVSTAPDPGSEEYAVVAEAAENGTATRRGRRELFYSSDTVRVDGTYYEVSETELESEEVTVYELTVSFDPADTTPELGEVTFDELPETDREKLGPIVTGENPDDENYRAAVDYGTAEEVGDDSVFVPEPEYDVVVHEGDRYGIAVESRPVSEGEYRYEVREIASSVGAFADRVREQYLFALEGLSEAERAVVEEAIDSGGYYEDDDAFRSVVDRIRDHEGIEEDSSYGTWLLEYEGAEYITYVEW